MSGAAFNVVFSSLFLFPGLHAFQLSNTKTSKSEATVAHDPHWYQAFAEGESTYTEQGIYNDKNPMHDILDGWEPKQHNAGGLSKEKLPAEWFAESESGGDITAYQTFYPALDSGLAKHGAVPGQWYRNAAGEWVQNYNTANINSGKRSGERSAAWFDSSVNQMDGFGRRAKPNPGSPQAFLAPLWQERSVNTTIGCADSGCSASSALQAYDPNTEIANNCRLTIQVHATDFDDDFSVESIEYWKANGQVLLTNCSPQARGCNATASLPLYPCVNSMKVDTVLNSLGALNIEGKISDMVDECPYDGNLLSALATVTCLVTPITTTTTTTTTTNLENILAIMSQDPTITSGENVILGAEPGSEAYAEAMSGKYPFARGVFQCDDPGCTATTSLYFNPDVALQGGTCTLTVNITQTDYDQDNGSEELIEFVQVAGTNISTSVAPGLNPCISEYGGSPIATAEHTYTVVDNQDVTTNVLNAEPAPGILSLSLKNSAKVDECGYQGHLLYGIAQIMCTAPDS